MPLVVMPALVLTLHYDSDARAAMALNILNFVERLGLLPGVTIELKERTIWLKRAARS